MEQRPAKATKMSTAEHHPAENDPLRPLYKLRTEAGTQSRSRAPPSQPALVAAPGGRHTAPPEAVLAQISTRLEKAGDFRGPAVNLQGDFDEMQGEPTCPLAESHCGTCTVARRILPKQRAGKSQRIAGSMRESQPLSCAGKAQPTVGMDSQTMLRLEASAVAQWVAGFNSNHLIRKAAFASAPSVAAATA
jgi:hypothetical protein